MRLTVIGSGTAAPEADHVCSGFLLEGHGVRALLDCGSGVVHSMARLGTDWQGITHLLITHFHNDHIGDVPMLFFAWKHGMRPARSQPLTVIGPKGTRKLLGRMAKVFGGHLGDPGFELTVRELKPGEEARLNDVVRLRTAKTRHTDESMGYRIEADGRALCYPGDTGPSETVSLFAQGADVLLVECAVPDDEAMEVHLTPSGVAQLARMALPRRLLLTHVYPWLDRAGVPDRVREAGWPGGAEMVADGMVVEI
jgi:ribonuclease BN (tRNA processing enzyme)